MLRRNFIKRSALLSCSTLVPAFLRLPSNVPLEASRTGKNLIVIQLSGGNDGLNTVIPYHDDVYYRERPKLSIDRSSLLPLNDMLGFNRGFHEIEGLFHQGEMAILNAVGYPNPNRSHFRSMDIWQTGAGSEEYLQTGWLGRYLDSECRDCSYPYQAIEIGDNLNLALQGSERKGFAMRGLEKLKKATGNEFLMNLGESYKAGDTDDNLNYLYKTMTEVQESAAYILERVTKSYTRAYYPDHVFGQGLRQIAELIMAEADTKVYYIELPGFDTHVNQKSRQERLLGIYSQAISALVEDLKSNHLFDDTLILTFSEFGRRVRENASEGTDHGAANNVFLAGGSLSNPGIYNDFPDLNRLDQGDIPYQIDFRSVYANILDKWLAVDARQVLPHHKDSVSVV